MCASVGFFIEKVGVKLGTVTVMKSARSTSSRWKGGSSCRRNSIR